MLIFESSTKVMLSPSKFGQGVANKPMVSQCKLYAYQVIIILSTAGDADSCEPTLSLSERTVQNPDYRTDLLKQFYLRQNNLKNK